MTPTIRTGGEGGWLPIETAPRGDGVDGPAILAIQAGDDIFGEPHVPLTVEWNGAWFGTVAPNEGHDMWPWSPEEAPDGHRFTHWMPLPPVPGAA